MSDYLPFIVVGLVTGAVYALASMGLVLTYTTSGVFNFAHGAVGMFATFVFYSLRVDVGLPTALAAAIAVLGVGPAMGIMIDRLLLRRLAGAPTATYIVTSLGLLVALQGLASVIWGAQTRSVDPIFPTSTYRLPGVNVGVDQTIVVGIAIAAGLGLAFFFRSTHLGLQTRAVVGDRNLTELVGANSSMVTSFSWMLGCAFAALSGVLIAPFIQLDSLLLTLLVVQAFGAAIIGRLRSLSLTNLGAYGIAIGASVATKLVASKPALVGLPTALPTLVLFLVLVVSRKGKFVEVTASAAGGAAQTARTIIQRRLPWRQIVAVTAVALVLPSFLNGSQLLTASTTVVFVLIFSSLSLMVGLSRQVSLCHTVFAVFGATTLSHLLTAGVPYPVALLLAGLVMVPVGALLAIPAIRLSGLFLALATFGFAVLAQSLLFSSGITFGRDALVFLGRPSMLAGDTAFYYFALAVVVAGVVVIEVIRVSRLGRFLRSLADSPTAVQSLGVNPTVSRVLVFCLSAFFAAIAGGLLGSLVRSINQTSFDAFLSLVWLTVLVAAGTTTFSGSVLAAVLFIAVPATFTSTTVVEWQPVAFGVAAMLLSQAPNGLAGVLFRRPDLAAFARRSAWRSDRRRAAERELIANLGRAG
ncbi:MAG TPA: ABC transporter permease [Acidimicrobiia bacterium]|nr:ABC transporter permease [Acidimicrobiia bacterium]